MTTSIAKVTVLLTLALACWAQAEDKDRELSEDFTNPITFKFVDEAGEPIEGTFTLHQTKNGKYIRNWHRYKPLNKKGEITITEFPPEFEFGGTSKNDFYHYWTPSLDLDPAKTTYLHRCSPTGAMRFEITKFPRKYHDSLVVEYHQKQTDGSHNIVKGIGIFPDDPEHTIGGLEPGEYFVAIKFEYEDKKPFYESKPFQVRLKEYTSLPKIEITEGMIDASKR